MAGTVYLYNLNENKATVSTNGGFAGANATGIVNGWAIENGYAPSYLAVARVNLSEDSVGKFRESDNTFEMAWPGAKGTSQNFYIPYGPDRVNIDDNLVCYVTLEVAYVYDTDGFLLKENGLQREWQVSG